EGALLVARPADARDVLVGVLEAVERQQLERGPRGLALGVEDAPGEARLAGELDRRQLTDRARLDLEAPAEGRVGMDRDGDAALAGHDPGDARDPLGIGNRPARLRAFLVGLLKIVCALLLQRLENGVREGALEGLDRIAHAVDRD